MDHARADLMRRSGLLHEQGTADALGRPVIGCGWSSLHRCRSAPDGAFDTVHDAAEPLGFLIAGDGEKVLYLTDGILCLLPGADTDHDRVQYSKDLDRNIEGEAPPGMRRHLLRSHMGLDRVLDFLAANDLTGERSFFYLTETRTRGV